MVIGCGAVEGQKLFFAVFWLVSALSLPMTVHLLASMAVAGPGNSGLAQVCAPEDDAAARINAAVDWTRDAIFVIYLSIPGGSFFNMVDY